MGFLSIPLAFVGYLLVYAATANHGRFAANPLTALFADAYTPFASGTAAPAPQKVA